jgi:predicted house-cleaning noncanonical NTP pyrophosphatase (MazG superfamily)
MWHGAAPEPSSAHLAPGSRLHGTWCASETGGKGSTLTDTYDKLVRDNIPAIIRATGRDCVVETMGKADYDRALRTKLVEAAREAAAVIVLEVVDVLCAAHGLDPATVRAAQDCKRAEQGGFTSRLRLRTVG